MAAETGERKETRETFPKSESRKSKCVSHARRDYEEKRAE